MKLRGLVSSLVLGLLVPIGGGAVAQGALWAFEEDGPGEALYEQSLQYFFGIGVEPDPAEALRLLLEAAEAGSVEAQADLGDHYYFLTFDQCHAAGMVALDAVLDTGFYSAPPKCDQTEAAKWYRMAADQDHSYAQFMLARLLSDAEGRLYSEDAVAEAIKLFQQSAEAGLVPAQYRFGRIYMDGEFVEADERIGLDWILRAAEQDLVEAQVYLGNYYFDHALIPQGGQKAFQWAMRAAASEPGMDRNQAFYLLGRIYAAGRGVPQSDAEAEKWFSAYAAGDEIIYPDSYWLVGVNYQQGIGLPKDLALAAKWYERGAQRGSSKAQSALGLMIGGGEGVPQDDAKAYFWLLLAASQRPDLAGVRDSLRALLSPQQIAQVQAEAARWKPISRAPEPRIP